MGYKCEEKFLIFLVFGSWDTTLNMEDVTGL